MERSNVIEMPARTSEAREATWGNLGADTKSASQVSEVLAAAGLDYTVQKVPVHLPSGIEVPNRFATVRQSDQKVYDIVSDRYTLIQNEEAFQFVDLIADEIQFERAGETQSGMVWLIASLPPVNVLGDEFVPHVIFRNGFSGNTKVTAAICPLRVVCQNQFNYAFQHAENTVKILHVGDVSARLQEAHEILALSAANMRTMTEEAERLARKILTKSQTERIIDGIFPIREGANPYANYRAEEQRMLFTKAYNHEDNGNFRGTAWGLLNAWSDFRTHLEPTGTKATKQENYFMKSVFSPAPMNDFLGRLLAA